jgi:uncharacterized protein (DUF1501 family)
MNDALAVLKTALGPVWSKTVVMTATEFGRTARPNGSGGTDHGTATALFLGGGAVAGKRVIANWPGLELAQLYQNRDLAPTTDFRSVAKAVLQAHLACRRTRWIAWSFQEAAEQSRSRICCASKPTSVDREFHQGRAGANPEFALQESCAFATVL